MGVRQWGFRIAHEKNKQQLRTGIIIAVIVSMVVGIFISIQVHMTPKKPPAHSFRIYIVPEVPNHNRKI